MKLSRYSCMIVVALAITACSPITVRLPGSTIRTPSLTKWLNAPACQLPCWEHIVPGVTSMADALTLLSQIPGIKITNRNQRNVEWVLDGIDTGWIDSNNNLVYSITLGVDVDERLSLSEVDGVYGPPAQVRLYRCLDGSCEVHLAYPDHGMVISLLLSDKGNNVDQVAIESSSLVGRVMLFQNLDKYYNFPDYIGGEFIDWKGYKAYP
jgi:hypothetical protein